MDFQNETDQWVEIEKLAHPEIQKTCAMFAINSSHPAIFQCVLLNEESAGKKKTELELKQCPVQSLALSSPPTPCEPKSQLLNLKLNG